MARKLSITVVVLVLLYALAGFVVLPWWLERAIPDRLARHLGWQATVESVSVNPFAMSVEAMGLAADDSDGEAVLAFDRLYVNLGVLRLVTGVVAVQSVELASPFARLDLRDDYSVNFARDWQANNPVSGELSDAPTSGEETTEPLNLFLDRVEVTGGEMLFRDFSQDTPQSFDISPLDLTLNNLATWPRDDGESDYYFKAAIGSQTVEWEGSLSLAPFSSSGFVQVSDVGYGTLAHFLGPHLPYQLRDGSLSVSSNYDMRLGEQFGLLTSGGNITVDNLALAVPGETGADDSVPENLASAGRIHLPEIAFDLIGRELSVGEVALENLDLGLVRNSDGMINAVEPFTGENREGDAPANQAENTGGADLPFRWSVAGVELKDASVHWEDNQLAKPAQLSFQQLALSVGRLSDRLEEPVAYRGDLVVGNGGRLSLQGQTTLQPFTLEAGIGITDLNLAQINAYLAEFTNLALADGLLSIDGNLDLDNQTAPMTGTFSGTAQISALDARLEGSDSPLLAWQTLRLEPLEYNLAPARLEIGTLTLSDPVMSVVREQGGLHNLSRIMPEAKPGPAAEEENGNEAGAEGFIFRVGQILLEGGELLYRDRTLEPVFSTRLDQLNGSITGLSNVSPQQGQLAIQGRAGGVASLKLDGSIGTLGTEDVSKLTLMVDGVSLPELSPYIGRYLGYGIANGKLDLDLDYTLAGSRIDATNHILLDRMELGSPITSDQAVNAPVKLGLALLRDRKGVIDIDLPIQGDLADPQFRLAPTVVRTFVNLIARAATSPFSILGSLADMTGLTGEELGYVSFQPGRVALGPEGEKKLEVLSTALAERPSLLLKVRGAVSPATDGDALKRQKLAEQLAISEQASPKDRIARLETRYRTTGFEQPLSNYRQQLTEARGSEPDDLAWEGALVDRLVATVELPSDILTELARQRGVWLRRQLQDTLGVPESQLFLLEPLQQAEQDTNGRVKVNFELEAR